MPLYLESQKIGELYLGGTKVGEGWIWDGAQWVQVYASTRPVVSMKMQRTTAFPLTSPSVYQKVTGMTAVTADPFGGTAVVGDELEANGDGSWKLDVAITHGNTASTTGVRVSKRAAADGSVSVLQTFQVASTFHSGVSGSVTAPVLRGDRVFVEAMHANNFDRNINSTTLTATAQ